MQTRRRFLGSAALSGASLLLPGCASGPARAPRRFGPNETIRVAVVGLRGRGKGLSAEFRKVPGVAVAALCDVDPEVLDQRGTEAKKLGAMPMLCADARRVLEDQSIDAVAIATPNHTHATLAIMALQAGKDVYVEKPVSHSLQEGRQLVAAARHYGRIVQAGLQNRSDDGLIAAYADLHRGELGALRAIHGICYRDRAGIGRRAAPLRPPPGLDYDLWLGPAQDLPILREQFHYDWHWCWNTGNGDIGNQGPHELDMVCWALRDPGLPREVLSVGGRYAWDDAGETPNALVTFFRFADAVPVSFEVRNLVPKQDPGYRGLQSTGVVIATERGELRAQRGGAVFVDQAGQTVKTYKGDSGATHVANFIAAMRDADRGLLRAEVERGHFAAALAHVANASYRLGQSGALAEARAAGARMPGLDAHLDGMAGNLAAHGVDVTKPVFAIGRVLALDPVSERCPSPSDTAANALLTREYRKGHELPRVGV